MTAILHKVIEFVLSFNGVFTKSHEENLPDEVRVYLQSKDKVLRIRTINEDSSNLKNDYLNVTKDLNKAYNSLTSRKEYSNG